MPTLDFLDSQTIYTIVHLVGVALGAGGAYASDFMRIKQSISVRFYLSGDNCF